MFRRRLQFRLRTLLLAQIAVAVGIVTYPFWSSIDLRPVENRPIPWQPFSQAALEEAKASGRPVLVHYYATWDMTGVLIRKRDLEIPTVRRAIYDHQYIPLLADWTEPDEEIKESLASHGLRTIPVTVIYSPQAPNQPTVLAYLPAQNQVLTAMKQAALSGGGPPPWNPFMSPLVGGVGVVLLIGLAHVLARNDA